MGKRKRRQSDSESDDETSNLNWNWKTDDRLIRGMRKYKMYCYLYKEETGIWHRIYQKDLTVLISRVIGKKVRERLQKKKYDHIMEMACQFVHSFANVNCLNVANLDMLTFLRGVVKSHDEIGFNDEIIEKLLQSAIPGRFKLFRHLIPFETFKIFFSIMSKNGNDMWKQFAASEVKLCSRLVLEIFQFVLKCIIDCVRLNYTISTDKQKLTDFVRNITIPQKLPENLSEQNPWCHLVIPGNQSFAKLNMLEKSSSFCRNPENESLIDIMLRDRSPTHLILFNAAWPACLPPSACRFLDTYLLNVSRRLREFLISEEFRFLAEQTWEIKNVSQLCIRLEKDSVIHKRMGEFMILVARKVLNVEDFALFDDQFIPTIRGLTSGESEHLFEPSKFEEMMKKFNRTCRAKLIESLGDHQYAFPLEYHTRARIIRFVCLLCANVIRFVAHVNVGSDGQVVQVKYDGEFETEIEDEHEMEEQGSMKIEDINLQAVPTVSAPSSSLGTFPEKRRRIENGQMIFSDVKSEFSASYGFPVDHEELEQNPMDFVDENCVKEEVEPSGNEHSFNSIANAEKNIKINENSNLNWNWETDERLIRRMGKYRMNRYFYTGENNIWCKIYLKHSLLHTSNIIEKELGKQLRQKKLHHILVMARQFAYSFANVNCVNVDGLDILTFLRDVVRSREEIGFNDEVIEEVLRSAIPRPGRSKLFHRLIPFDTFKILYPIMSKNGNAVWNQFADREAELCSRLVLEILQFVLKCIVDCVRLNYTFSIDQQIVTDFVRNITIPKPLPQNLSEQSPWFHLVIPSRITPFAKLNLLKKSSSFCRDPDNESLIDIILRDRSPSHLILFYGAWPPCLPPSACRFLDTYLSNVSRRLREFLRSEEFRSLAETTLEIKNVPRIYTRLTKNSAIHKKMGEFMILVARKVLNVEDFELFDDQFIPTIRGLTSGESEHLFELSNFEEMMKKFNASCRAKLLESMGDHQYSYPLEYHTRARLIRFVCLLCANVIRFVAHVNISSDGQVVRVKYDGEFETEIKDENEMEEQGSMKIEDMAVPSTSQGTFPEKKKSRIEKRTYMFSNTFPEKRRRYENRFFAVNEPINNQMLINEDVKPSVSEPSSSIDNHSDPRVVNVEKNIKIEEPTQVELEAAQSSSEPSTSSKPGDSDNGNIVEHGT